MKIWMKLAIVALLTIALTACNGDEEKSKDNDKSAPKKDEKTAQVDKKKLEEQMVKDDKVIALVNGEELKGAQYNQVLTQVQDQYKSYGQDPTKEETAKKIKDQIMKSIINFEVVLQDADKKGYTASDKDVEKELQTIIEKNYENDRKKFDEALKKNDLTEKELKAQVQNKLTYDTYMDKEIKVDEVSEKEAKDYYDKFKEQSKGQEVPPYEDVKSTIKTQLQSQKKQDKMNEKIETLKKDAKIVVLI